MSSNTPSTFSTIREESPVDSDSFHELRLNTFSPHQPRYEFLFDPEYLHSVVVDSVLPILTRVNLLPVMHTLMEWIEARPLGSVLKKRLAMDTLMFWSEQSGLSLAEFDLYLLSSTIDFVADLGRHGTSINHAVHTERAVQVSEVETTCCFLRP